MEIEDVRKECSMTDLGAPSSLPKYADKECLALTDLEEGELLTNTERDGPPKGMEASSIRWRNGNVVYKADNKLFWCWSCFGLCWTIFNIIALGTEGSGVSEIHSGNKMCWTLSLATAMGPVSSLSIFWIYREDGRDNPSCWESFLNTMIVFALLFIIFWISVNSFLLHLVLNIPMEHKEAFEEFSLFWYAAQIQAFSFLGEVLLVPLGMLCSPCLFIFYYLYVLKG